MAQPRFGRIACKRRHFVPALERLPHELPPGSTGRSHDEESRRASSRRPLPGRHGSSHPFSPERHRKGDRKDDEQRQQLHLDLSPASCVAGLREERGSLTAPLRSTVYEKLPPAVFLRADPER